MTTQQTPYGFRITDTDGDILTISKGNSYGGATAQARRERLGERRDQNQQITVIIDNDDIPGLIAKLQDCYVEKVECQSCNGSGKVAKR